MAKTLVVPKTENRREIYQFLIPQVQAVIADESDLVANLANITAMIKEAFGFFWVGFYWVKGGELVLGPFQGSLACTRIAFGKGVCGSAYKEARTLLVVNVDEFPGHIACSSLSKSEIVVPILDSTGQVVGVLDIDSDKLADFSKDDQIGLESIVQVLQKKLNG